MRVTENMRMNDLIRNLGNLTSRQAEAAQQASTGIRLDKASTDPFGASQVSKIRSALRQTQSYRDNISLARGDVETTENALEGSINLFMRAREIAVQGANDSLSAQDRATLANEVQALREQMLTFANTESSYGSLFSGNQTDAPAFSVAGAYLGDGGERMIEVGKNVTMQVNVSGQEAFAGAGGGVDVFAQLDTLQAALLADDSSQISGTLDGIDQASDQLISARSNAGLMLDRLDTADQSLEQGQVTLNKRQSAVTDADMFSSISTLTQLNTTLEQAISVARTTLNVNLSRF